MHKHDFTTFILWFSILCFVKYFFLQSCYYYLTFIIPKYLDLVILPLLFYGFPYCALLSIFFFNLITIT
jgi:hypothetical protein